MNRSDMFDLTDGVDRLTVGPRHVQPVTDDLLMQIAHRTTGGPRSVLLTRSQAEGLHEWLGRWLAEGWDGVRKEDPIAYARAHVTSPGAHALLDEVERGQRRRQERTEEDGS